jgi:hypothetical protein
MSAVLAQAEQCRIDLMSALKSASEWIAACPEPLMEPDERGGHFVTGLEYVQCSLRRGVYQDWSRWTV